MRDRISILRPDDWHIHLRDGPILTHSVADVARTFGRAIVMPNLVPPVRTTEEALAYRTRILAARPEQSKFEPLMVLYLTDQTTVDNIHSAKASGLVHAAKLYPAGATTHSAAGVTRIENLLPVFAAMAAVDLPLLVHGEVTHAQTDIFDREKAFIDQQLSGIVTKFPELRIVLEHITTADAVAFVTAAPANVAATITPHHLLYNRNHLLVGGIRPHLYCLPVLKRQTHQEALQQAAISGNPKFFLGTDSAPHARNTKESACGCAGCYSVHVAIELYAEVFDQLGALERLEAFASHFGADFYKLPRNSDYITLVRQESSVPHELPMGEQAVVPLRAGQSIHWQQIEPST